MRRMYSENQIVKVLEDKDVKVKRIEQSEVNASYDFSNPNLGSRELSFSYNKAFIINNILYVLVNGALHNPTEESIASGNISFDIVLPDEVGDKIFCLDGEKLSDDFTSQKIICTFCVGSSTSLGYIDSLTTRSITKSSKNTLRVNVNLGSMVAGSYRYISGRTFLSLI